MLLQLDRIIFVLNLAPFGRSCFHLLSSFGIFIIVILVMWADFFGFNVQVHGRVAIISNVVAIIVVI